MLARAHGARRRRQPEMRPRVTPNSTPNTNGKASVKISIVASKPSRAAEPSQVDWCDPDTIALRNKESGRLAALAIDLHTIAGSAKQRLPAIARDALLKIEFEHRSDL